MGIAQTAAGQILTAQMVNELPVVVSYLATGSLSNTNAETVIGTFTIPAGDPTFPGGYWFYVHGVATETASPNFTLRVRLNSVTGTILAAAGPAALTVTPATFDILLWLMMESIGSSGSFGCTSQASFSNSGIVAFGSEATAINTTGANTLVVTGQFGTANASNTATSKGGALYRL